MMFKLSKSTNKLIKQIFVILLFLTGGGITASVMMANSSWNTGVGEFVEQPLAFPHQTHVADLGLECEFCHTGVRTKNSADMPSMETCYGCHREILKDTEFLRPVRDGYLKKRSIPWERVNKLADHVHFNHVKHIRAGVGCVSCHGEVAQMPLMTPAHHFSMKFCLDCHRQQPDAPKLQDCYTCHR